MLLRKRDFYQTLHPLPVPTPFCRNRLIYPNVPVSPRPPAHLVTHHSLRTVGYDLLPFGCVLLQSHIKALEHFPRREVYRLGYQRTQRILRHVLGPLRKQYAAGPPRTRLATALPKHVDPCGEK